jgi:hypothetical protein
MTKIDKPTVNYTSAKLIAWQEIIFPLLLLHAMRSLLDAMIIRLSNNWCGERKHFCLSFQGQVQSKYKNIRNSRGKHFTFIFAI